MKIIFEFVFCKTAELLPTLERWFELGWDISEQNYIGKDMWELVFARETSHTKGH